MEKKYLSIQVVAERWGISYRAVRDLIAAGKLPAARFGGRRYRIELADVEAHEEAAKVAGAETLVLAAEAAK